MYLPIQITSDNKPEKENVEGLLDSGAGGKFIDLDYADNIHVEKKDLRKPIKVYNVDGTPNKRGTITQYVDLDLTIHKRKRKHRLLVTSLGRQKIILGYPWLKEMNPLIDWRKGTLEWRKWKNSTLRKSPDTPEEQSVERTVEYYTFVQGVLKRLEKPEGKKAMKNPITIEEEDKEKHLNSTQNPLEKDELSTIVSTITGETDHDTWINAKLNKAMEIQAKINQGKQDLPLEKQIPKEFHEYLDVSPRNKRHGFQDIGNGIIKSH